ncbi:MAG: sugar phosphate nucleotidyltransferase [Victivallaceae bacterium]
MKSMQYKLNAMVLAAGLGTRLRPLTEIMPKPLMPVCNRPMLEIVMSNLRETGIAKFVVNTHYLPEMVNDFISRSSFKDMTEIFHEPEILGTGGGPVNARKVLSQNDFFIIHNSDILTDMNLSALIEHHFKSGRKITMALTEGPENRVRVTPDGMIHDILSSLGRNPAGSRLMTYCGVMVLSRDIFKYLPEVPVNCSIIRGILEMMKAEPEAVGAYLEKGIYWNDLGTLDQYFAAHKDILGFNRVKLPCFQSLHNYCIDKTAEVSATAELSGFCAAGSKAKIHDAATVMNCILFDGAEIAPGDFRCNEIITPQMSIHRNIHEIKRLQILSGMDFSRIRLTSLREQGSLRGFYRITDEQKSSILMLSDGMDVDFDRFIYIGRFLSKFNFPTPEIYAFEPEEFSVLMEDMGNETVFRRLQHLKEPQDIDLLYEKIIDALLDFQLRGTALFKRSDAPILRTFDRSYLRWETQYFGKQFLEGYCHIPADECNALNPEFDQLAIHVGNQPRIFMHRDFQSQNIMVHEGRMRFVDFQGARIGPVGYDIMALINDCYIHFDCKHRHHLADYYCSRLKEMDSGFADVDLGDCLITAGLQRNMQALGAYGFLGLNQGKKQYLDFIPRGLELLKEGIHNFMKSNSKLHLSVLAALIERL